MPFFRYKLLTEEGAVDSGVVELPFNDVSPAIRYLERQGGVILEIQMLGRILSSIVQLFTKRLKRVSRLEMAEFFNNMGMLLSAGVPVLTALKDITRDSKNPVMTMTIKMIRTDIASGQSFSEALSRHGNLFSPIILQMIQIGEETGRLDKMLFKCSEHLRNIQEIVSSTIRALLYPCILLVLVLGATIFWFAWVVPKIVGLFIEMDIQLPGITKLLIAIAGFVQNWSFFIFVGCIVFIMVLALLRRKSLAVKYYSDLVLLKIPILSTIIETSIIARTSEYLGILIGAGIGIMRTLDMLTETMKNSVYQHRLLLVKENIKSGNSLSYSLRNANAMHPFALRMIAVGEDTGKIEEQTEYVATIYRNKLRALVDTLSKSLEPAMIIFLGLLFILIIAGLLLPIYDLVGDIQ